MSFRATKVVLLLLIFMFFSLGCSDDNQDNTIEEGPVLPDRVSISQGVWGTVRFFEGNHMPGVVDRALASQSPSITPVSRVLHIYSSTNMSDNESNRITDGFYENINSDLVAVAYSDQEGFYQVELPVGVYSVFTEEEGGLYASRGGPDFLLNPVEIEEGSLPQLDIDITYAATF